MTKKLAIEIVQGWIADSERASKRVAREMAGVSELANYFRGVYEGECQSLRDCLRLLEALEE